MDGERDGDGIKRPVEGSPARRADYRLARIATASVLLGLLSVLELWAAADHSYHVDSYVFFGLLGGILALLGLEAFDFIRRA